MEPRAPGFRKSLSALRRELPPRQSRTESDSPIVKGLNAAQRTAVTTPSSIVQILAPPGSGKTRTLTSRVAYLLSEPLILNPQNVIVATFTVKAANEMKERLSKLVGEGVERRLLLGTFHSICRRYLLKYGHLIGLKQGWGIADSGDSKAICKRIIKRRGLADVVDPKQLQSRISHFKARNMSPQANTFPTVHSTNPSTQQTQKKQRDIATDDFVMLYEDYHVTLESSNLLDYDDLLLRCLELMKENPECVSNIEAVLIDEFQDTNIVQYELMRKFAWKQQRITVVGDPDQSIYSFRAAEIGNARRMCRHYPDTLIVNLEENYRSSASILQAALVVIQQDSRRIDKTLTATHPIGPSPVLRRAHSAASEAEWIVGEIKRLRAITAGMVSLDGVAILVRSAHLTRLIETALTRQRLPYKMVGGTRFFDRVEVKVVVDYLRVLQNPSSNDALVRVINVPSRKVGDMTVKGLLEDAEQKKRTLWDAIYRAVRGDSAWGTKVTKLAERGMGLFVGLMAKTMEKLDDQDSTLAEIVENLLTKLGYETYLQKEYPDDFDSRWSNVQELIYQAREVKLDDDEEALPEIDGVQQKFGPQKTPRAALERFLANAALMNETQRGLETPEEKAPEITLSTIHAAKGLEWPVVFVPAVYEGSIPHSRAEDIDEERRLLYVAMTRAQALLYLSCPFHASAMTTGNGKVKLSPFVDTPAITRLVTKRASDLTFSNVQTLSQILSVPCPTEMDIEASIESSGILSRSDDQIPDNDPSEKDDKVDRTKVAYQGGANGERLDRNVPRFQSARGFVNVSTTEYRIRHKTTTADRVGFRSASNHLSELRKRENVTCEADKALKEKRASHDRMIRPMTRPTVNDRQTSSTNVEKTMSATTARKEKCATTATARPTSRPTGQGSLMSFFTEKPPEKTAPLKNPTKPMTATEAVKCVTANMSLKEQVDSLPAPIIPKRAGGDFILLSSSPPRPIKKPKVKPEASKMNRVHGIQKQPSPPVAEGSDHHYSPPSSPMFRAFCEAMSEDDSPLIVKEVKALQHHSEGLFPEPKKETKAPAELESVGLPPPLDPKPPLARAGGAQKRTLGIRRSMNGWANRGRRHGR